ncbi:Gfo/Idh/MocA family protein [Paenibacillus septentrionalis]|uniref:Gfo/Idh/MocA family protein n=1 Tax=Paenibacillus septentrionalis TaxID=429342 RepID=A0ABW1V2V6_9BACL
MSKLKVAVIGCGQIARTQHVPSYVKSGLAEIKYLVDGIIERADELAAEYNVPYTTTDFEKVLADPEIDAISVCTPNASHAPISIAALNAGKHVLCEKPAALSYTEALEMKQAADRNNKILNIGVVNRFNTAVNKIKELVEAGELGDLYHVYCSFRSHRSIPGLGGPFTSKEKSGGGVLIDWGVHFLDLIFYILGENTKALTVSGAAYGELGRNIKEYAYTSMWAGPPVLDGSFDVEDFVTGLIRTSGPTINLNGAWAQNIGEKAMFVEFLGSKAGIKLQYGGEFTLYTSKNGMLYETAATFAQEDMFAAEVKSFLESIAGMEKNRANIDHTLVTTQVMDALYESAAKGKEVSL